MLGRRRGFHAHLQLSVSDHQVSHLFGDAVGKLELLILIDCHAVILGEILKAFYCHVAEDRGRHDRQVTAVEQIEYALAVDTLRLYPSKSCISRLKIPPVALFAEIEFKFAACI